MNEWNKLSMTDRAAYIKLGIDNGITDLATIRDTYNKYAEGGKKDSLNKSESIESKVSTAIMNLIHRGKLKPSNYPDPDLIRDGGVPQRTYLLSREELRKEFLNAGYIEGKEGDYGLVRKAVGDRNIPIYQREPDAAKREDLVPIGNIDSMYYPKKGKLIHAGHYPTALYYNYQDNKLYLKAWDLNDYGGNTGYAKKYNFLQKLGVNILDKIGSPTVVTSGFLEIPEDVFNYNYNELFPYLKNFYKSKGLEYDFLVDPYKDTPTPHLPEIVVTNKSEKYAEGGEKNSNDNWTMLDEVNYRTWRNELPDNLKYTNDNEYDMRGAYKAGMTPLYIKEDNSYHLGSRDPYSGKILKAPHHPTFLKALITDASMGYYPSTDNKGNTYTTTWIGNKFGDGGSENNNFPLYIPEGYTYNSGEINQAPTTTLRIINKTKDIGRAVAAFVPFLGTVLDYYDDNMLQIPTGTIGDMGDVLRYSSSKIGTKADKMTTTKINTRKRGSVRSSLLHNTNKNVGTNIGKIGPKLAKNLGIVGMAIDTPNFVSDLENLKRALGLNYNEGLILK